MPTISVPATGAPTDGTWAVGQQAVDSAGHIWVCTVAGTPGTWVKEANFADVLQNQLTLIAAGLHFVSHGGSGAPASGAHTLGDLVMDAAGTVFVCTANGTPGTWAQLTVGAASTFVAAAANVNTLRAVGVNLVGSGGGNAVYVGPGGTVNEQNATETNVAVKFYDRARTLRNLRALVPTDSGNNLTDMVITVMKNGSAQSLTVSFGSSATGAQEDITHTVSYAAGDTMSFKVSTADTNGAHSNGTGLYITADEVLA